MTKDELRAYYDGLSLSDDARKRLLSPVKKPKGIPFAAYPMAVAALLALLVGGRLFKQTASPAVEPDKSAVIAEAPIVTQAPQEAPVAEKKPTVPKTEAEPPVIAQEPTVTTTPVEEPTPEALPTQEPLPQAPPKTIPEEPSDQPPAEPPTGYPEGVPAEPPIGSSVPAFTGILSEDELIITNTDTGETATLSAVNFENGVYDLLGYCLEIIVDETGTVTVTVK